MSLVLETPREMSVRIAARVRAARLAHGLSQQELAERAGMAVSSYRLFERTGQIALEKLLSIASVLGRTTEWDGLFAPRAAQSLDEIEVGRPTRQRAPRRRRRADGEGS